MSRPEGQFIDAWSQREWQDANCKEPDLLIHHAHSSDVLASDRNAQGARDLGQYAYFPILQIERC